MKRFLSFLLISVFLLSLLVGCQTYPDDPQEAMIQAYLKSTGYNIPSSDLLVEYLGCFEDVHVGMMGGLIAVSPAGGEEDIGEYEFRYFDSRRLQAYRNGKIQDLSEAYKAGWVSDDSITQIYAEYIDMYPGLYEDYWMRAVYLTQFDKTGKYTIDDVRIESYGTYNRCLVAFVDTYDSNYTDTITEETIAGYTFCYTSSRTLKVYKGRQYKSLQEAYDAGWLEESDLGFILLKHTGEK